MSKGLLIPIPGPGPPNNPVCVLPADFNRSVRTKRIDDDDLVTPAQALKTIADVLLLVETNHDGGDRGPWTHGASWGPHSSQKIEVPDATIKRSLHFSGARGVCGAPFSPQ